MFTSNSVTITNLNLISALLTVGAEIGEKPINIKSENGDKLTFFFKDCQELDDYLKIWNNADIREKEGKNGNTFAFIAEAFIMREQLLDSIKQFKKVAVISRNGRTAIISENTPTEVKNNILSKL